MSPKIQDAIRNLDAQKEAVLMEFVISGAMIRDLRTEVGQLELVEVAPFCYELHQDFRIV